MEEGEAVASKSHPNSPKQDIVNDNVSQHASVDVKITQGPTPRQRVINNR